MVNLPIAVRECQKKLRVERGCYVSVKTIKGKYYAFEVKGRWDKQLKKGRTLTNYLGRIKENGTFIPAAHRNTASNIGEKQIGETDTTWLRGQEKAILRNLSMNAQMPVSVLAKKLKLSPSATRYAVGHAEKKFGIRYITEIDTEAMGYSHYVTLVRFVGKIPSVEQMKEALGKEPAVQLALLTKGKYDLVFFSLAKDSREIALLLSGLLSTSFSSYEARWYTSPYYSAYDFIPLRDAFFGLLLKDNRVWKRKMDRETRKWRKKLPGQLTEQEFLVLRELNQNGNGTFSDIEKKYQLAKGTAQYFFRKLKGAGIIKRATITMENLPIRYNAMISATILNWKEFAKTRANFLFDVIQETEGPVNRYVASGDIEVPKGIIFITPIFHDGDLELAEEGFRSKVKGIKLRSLVITDVFLGRLCYRRIDNDYSKHYRALVEEEKALNLRVKEKY